jgi:hypothetical protein
MGSWLAPSSEESMLKSFMSWFSSNSLFQDEGENCAAFGVCLGFDAFWGVGAFLASNNAPCPMFLAGVLNLKQMSRTFRSAG